MSTIGATETQVRTYGNWRHPRLAGLGKLSFVQTMALLALLIVSFLIYGSFGLAHAAVPLISGLCVFGGLEIRDAHGEYDPITGGSAAPIGRGKFLLKTSDAPAHPFQVDFTPVEYELSNTNKRW